MLIEVDFDSDEAIYIQLCNQIILGDRDLGDTGGGLPPVGAPACGHHRGEHAHGEQSLQCAQEGRDISVWTRGGGAVIALDIDKMEQLEEMRRQLRIVLARGCCKNVSRQEVHDLVDEIFDDYE